LKYYTIDKGLSGGSAGTPPAFVAMCHLMCDSVDAYESANAPYARGDIANFTNVVPVKLVSDVVVENSGKD